MWCNPWELKEIIRPLVVGGCVAGLVVLSLYVFAKITYKIHKRNNKKK